VHSEVIREGVFSALSELLQDDDILRDFFAAAALRGILSSPHYHPPGTIPGSIIKGDRIAQLSYEIADSMLAARKTPAKKPPGKPEKS
jgi:hypothetical protein